MKSSFSTDAVLIWHSGGKYVPKISQPCAQTFLNAFSKLFSFPEGLASRLPGIWSGASTTMEVHGALVTLVVTCQSTALLFFSTKWNTKNKGGEEEQTCRCFFSTHLLPLHTLENNGCVTHTQHYIIVLTFRMRPYVLPTSKYASVKPQASTTWLYIEKKVAKTRKN